MPIGNCTDEDVDYDVKAIHVPNVEQTHREPRPLYHRKFERKPERFEPGDELRFLSKKDGSVLAEVHFLRNEVRTYVQGKLLEPHKHRTPIIMAGLHKSCEGTYTVEFFELNQAEGTPLATALGMPEPESGGGGPTLADLISESEAGAGELHW